MQRIALAILTLWALVATPAWAQGNPHQLLKAGQTNFGLEADYLVEQKFKDYDLERRFSDGTSNSDRASASFREQSMFMATATLGLNDWLNIYGKAGVVEGGKWADHTLSTGEAWQAKFKNQFVWATGLKAQVWKMQDGPGVLVSGQYLRYDDRKIKEWKSQTGGYNGETYYNIEDKLNYYWQADLMATAYWSLGKFTPYLGAGVSYAEARYTGHWGTGGATPSMIDYDATLKSEDILLAQAGCDLDLGNRFSVNLQGSFVARNELSLGLSYAF